MQQKQNFLQRKWLHIWSFAKAHFNSLLDMLPIEIFSLWTISLLQATVSLTPTGLVALANLQNQRARALANALNFRTRTKLARSRANLANLGGDLRVPRSISAEDFSDEDNFEDRHVPTIDQIVFQDVNDVNKPEDDVNQDGRFQLDERLGVKNPMFDFQTRNTEPYENREYFGQIMCPVCRNNLRNLIPPWESYENLVFTCPICDQTIKMGSNPMSYTSPQPYENIQNPEILKPFQTNPSDTNQNFNYMPLEENQRDADPHFHHHGRGILHTHTHIYEIRPLPEMLPISKTITVQPKITNIVQPTTVPNSNVFGIESKSDVINHNPGIIVHDGAHLPFHKSIGTNVNQAQSLHINPEQFSDKQIVINQNQEIHKAKHAESEGNQNNQDVEINNKDELVSTFLLPNLVPNTESYIPTYPNEYNPRTFDPAKPQNRQKIVKYIEDEQKSIDELLKFLNKEKPHDLFKAHTSIPIPKIKDYSLPPNPYTYKKNYRPEVEQYPILPYETYPHSFEPNFQSNFNNPTNLPNYDDSDESFSTEPITEFNDYGSRSSLRHFRRRENVLSAPPTEFTGFEDIPYLSPSPLNTQVDDSQSLFRNYFEIEQNNIQTGLKKMQEEHEKNYENLLNSLKRNTENVPNQEQNQYETYDSMSRSNSERNVKPVENITEKDSTLRNIFEVPPNYPPNREARSVDNDKLKNIIYEEKLDNNVDKNFNLGKYSTKTGNRKKREFNDSDNPFLKRLINDPKLQLDIQKTLEKLGSATKATFENKRQPMYHLQKIVGSTRDALMSALNIPNQSFIIPSSYDIVKKESKTTDQKVGDINTALFNTHVTVPGNIERESFVEDNAFQKVGSLIRKSVKSGKATVGHIGDIVKQARNALYNVRYATPQIFSNKAPSYVKNPPRTNTNTVLITPRILEFTEGENQVDNPLDDSEITQTVTVGNIFDATGISEPQRDLDIEEITIKSKRPDLLGQTQYSRPLNNINIRTLGNIDDPYVERTLNNLYMAQTSFGMNSLKEFMDKLKRDFQNMMQSSVLGMNILRKEVPKEKIYQQAVRTNKKIDNSQPKNGELKETEEIVKASYIPEQLTHPFLNQTLQSQIENYLRMYRSKQSKRESLYENESTEPILGSINPVLFERTFNEPLGTNNNENDTVSTMHITGQLLKPFMGHSNTAIREFYQKYRPDFQDYSQFVIDDY